MLPLYDAQNQILSQKYQKSLSREEWKSQYDFPSSISSIPLDCDVEQSPTSPSTQYCQQKSQSKHCLDEVKSQVNREELKQIHYNMIPRKKCKGFSRPFSRLEDELILHLVDQFGPKFRKFVKFFSGRQATILKNRFYKFLRSEHLMDKEAARRKVKTNKGKGKEINKINEPKNSFMDQHKQIQQCLIESEFSIEVGNIMGNCVNNLFTLFQNMLK